MVFRIRSSMRRPTIRTSLLWLVLGTLLPLLVFVGIVLAINTRLQEKLTEDRLLGTTRALALAVDRDLRSAQVALEVLAMSPTLDRGDWAGVYERAATIGDAHGGWIVVRDLENRQILNTARPFGAPLPPGSDIAAAHLVLGTGRPAVSDLFVGAVMQRPLIAVVVPVLRGGAVRYLLFMGLLPERIALLLGTQPFEPGWIAAVFDRKGQVITRLPDAGAAAPTPAPDLVAAIRGAREGWVRSTALEGTPAYFAFVRVPQADWTVALAIPAAAAYADAARSLRLIAGAGLAAIVVGSLLALTLGRRIAAPLGRLAAAARADHANTVPPPLEPGIAEIVEVYQALRSAAEGRRREALEHDRRVAEEARRQAAERALDSIAASEERWRALFEQAGEAILVGDPDGTCRDANAAACQLLGYPRGELAGTPLHRILAGEEAGRLAGVVAALRQPESHVSECTLRRRDGTPLPAEVHVQILGDGRWQAFVRDITERRRLDQERLRVLAHAESARAEAEAVSRMKDDFLATLSHELRTPLNSMMGWLHLLRAGGLDAGRVAHALDVIERNIQAQSFLIRDLLDVSQIIRGELVLHPRREDLSSLVGNGCDALRPAIDAKGVELVCRLEPNVVGTVDRERIQQVLWNLLTNALKFTPSGGRIEVDLERAGDEHARLRVTDTGYGIRPALLPRLFERFQQAEAPGVPESRGLGIGLSIVRHVVERHGGTVTAESQGPGTGATFTVLLPLRPAANDPPAAGGPQRATVAGRRLLIVDDDPDTREMLRSLLARQGAHADAAAGAREALRLLAGTRYDVIVSDTAMSGIDGYGLLAEIRRLPPEQGAGTPVVALTAYAGEERRVRLAGFQGHLAKPVDARVLVATIARLLGEVPAA